MGEAVAPMRDQVVIATKLHRLEENIGAASISLTSHEMRAIAGILETTQVLGERYPEALEKRTGL